MKKIIISSIAAFLLVGCVNNNNVQIDKKIKEVNLDKTLMKKYHITKNNLIPFGKFYIFDSPSSNGTDIVFLDKNYNEIKKFSTSYFFDTKKIAVSKDKIYILGINEENYYPELLILNKDGKLIKKIVFPKKYALVKDLYLKNGNNYVLIDIFKNGKSYIEIYKNGKLLKKLELKQSINGSFVFKLGNDLILIGTVKNTTQDAFVADLTKGWIRFFDLGMDENIDKYKIDGNKMILDLHSSDDMGADSYYEIILDSNGKILKNKCKIKFKPALTK